MGFLDGSVVKNLPAMWDAAAARSLQSCPILCDPRDCSPPGSSIHGIFQARIREWLPFPSPGDLPNPGIEPGSPALQADALPSEPPGKQTSSEHKLCARHCIATKVENDTDRSKGLCPHRANSLQG